MYDTVRRCVPLRLTVCRSVSNRTAVYLATGLARRGGTLIVGADPQGPIYGGEFVPKPAVDDFLVHAFDSQAITAANDSIRGHPKQPAAVPVALATHRAIPAPTAEECIPSPTQVLPAN